MLHIALGGCEVRANREMLLNFGSPCVMLSFYYLQQRKDLGVKILAELRARGVWVLIDSGAYTLMNRFLPFRCDLAEDGQTMHEDYLAQSTLDKAVERLGDTTRLDMRAAVRNYFEGYLVWLREYSNLYDAAGDFNVAPLLCETLKDGTEEMWEWRRRFFSDIPGASEKIIITPQVHIPADMAKIFSPTWKHCIKYVGIGYHPTRDFAMIRDFFQKNMSDLVTNRVRVHFWKWGNQNIKKYPFASTSSAQWLTAARFHGYFQYVGGLHMRRAFGGRRVDQRLSLDAEDAGVDMVRYRAGDRKIITRMNAYQWVRYQKDALEQTRNAYYVDSPERQRTTALVRARYRTDTALERHNYEVKPAHLADASVMQFARFCNTCFISAQCPAYKPDSTCKIAQRGEVRTQKQLSEAVCTLIELQLERTQFAAYAERVQGMVLDPDTSKEFEASMRMIQRGFEVLNPSDTLTIRATSRSGVGGRMHELFGGYGGTGRTSPGELQASADDNASVIDVTPDD